MKASTKILIGGVAVALGWKGMNLITKAKNLKDNLFVKPELKKFTNFSATSVTALINAALTNYSGFNLNVKNVYSKLVLVLKDGTQMDAGLSSVTPSISFKNNETKAFDLSFTLSYFTIALKVITGNVKTINVVTFYDYAGQQLQYVSTIDVQKFADKLKSKNTVSGVGSIDLL
ncbi:MAG: hypothetical protein PSX42_11190 [bacterium]|nr:hypothetical protein [bacterium]